MKEEEEEEEASTFPMAIKERKDDVTQISFIITDLGKQRSGLPADVQASADGQYLSWHSLRLGSVPLAPHAGSSFLSLLSWTHSHLQVQNKTACCLKKKNPSPEAAVAMKPLCQLW